MRLSSILHPLPKYIFCQYFKCTSFGVRDNGYYWRQMSQTDKFPFIKKITFWYLYNGKECINLVSLTESCPLHPSFNQCNTIRIGFSMLQKWFIVKDRGARCAVVHGVIKSKTRLSDWTITKAMDQALVLLVHILTSSSREPWKAGADSAFRWGK